MSQSFSLTQPYRDLSTKLSNLGGQRPGSLPLHSMALLMKWEAAQLPVEDKHPKPSEQLLNLPEALSRCKGADAGAGGTFLGRCQSAVLLADFNELRI